MIRLFIRDWLFDEIIQGTKVLDVRVYEGAAARIRVGDIVAFTSSSRSMSVRITKIQSFANFDIMLAAIPYQRFTSQLRSHAHALRALRQIYSPEREAKGVIVFTIERV